MEFLHSLGRQAVAMRMAFAAEIACRLDESHVSRVMRNFLGYNWDKMQERAYTTFDFEEACKREAEVADGTIYSMVRCPRCGDEAMFGFKEENSAKDEKADLYNLRFTISRCKQCGAWAFAADTIVTRPRPQYGAYLLHIALLSAALIVWPVISERPYWEAAGIGLVACLALYAFIAACKKTGSDVVHPF